MSRRRWWFSPFHSLSVKSYVWWGEPSLPTEVLRLARNPRSSELLTTWWLFTQARCCPVQNWDRGGGAILSYCLSCTKIVSCLNFHERKHPHILSSCPLSKAITFPPPLPPNGWFLQTPHVSNNGGWSRLRLTSLKISNPFWWGCRCSIACFL